MIQQDKTERTVEEEAFSRAISFDGPSTGELFCRILLVDKQTSQRVDCSLQLSI